MDYVGLRGFQGNSVSLA